MTASPRDKRRLCLDFAFLTFFTWLIACIGLAAIRTKFPSNLLFDQFCLLTLFVFMISFYLSHGNRKFLSRSIQLLSPEAKLFASMTIALLFFSTVQYSVLAVDRSRSLYIFSWVNDGVIQSIDGQIIIGSTTADPEGLNDVEAIAQRIQEQSSRGLMTTEGSTVQLTLSGKAILSISKLLAIVFNLSGWFAHT